MQISTKYLGWLGAAMIVFAMSAPVLAQRTVTLTVNMATTSDTVRTDSFIEVRGAVDGVAPFTLAGGDVIDWSDASTIEPVNIGGDYWQYQLQIAETTDLTFKYYSQQLQDVLGEGWEADPNPVVAAGAGDIDLGVHFFESQREYRGVSGNRGDYDWRPYEAKEDSVAVWYRVYMATPEGAADGYDRTNDLHHASVTGEKIYDTSPMDWGTTTQALTRESSAVAAPGFDIFSGVVYYPNSVIGTAQPYKFVLQDNSGILGWEEGNVTDNRSFNIPAQDTTIQWVYYGDTVPSALQPVSQNVIFAVNLDAYEDMGIFSVAAGDTLEVRGEFNGWGCGDPTLCLMDRVPGTNEYEGFYTLTSIPEKEMAYKYFLNFNDVTFEAAHGFLPPAGWEEGHATGVNRVFEFSGTGFDQDLGLQFFNDITAGNVIPAGTNITVNYSIDMNPAVANAARPFNPSIGDSVWISIEDPMWKLSQRLVNPDLTALMSDPAADRPRLKGVLSDADGNFVYEGSIVIMGPTYSALTYKFVYGQNSDEFAEPGTGLGNNPGRNRTEYIDMVGGNWPASYATLSGVFSLEGALPFETNPVFSVDVEEFGSELPRSITLDQNYPNPFNPLTTFEYTLNAAQHVQLNIYDLLGRKVATVVNGVQAASSYRVRFDGNRLTSGTYFYRLETENATLTRKMILLK